jgi:membrane associated rhomboid family serine protease
VRLTLPWFVFVIVVAVLSALLWRAISVAIGAFGFQIVAFAAALLGIVAGVLLVKANRR